jgi:hypothetical protein
MPQLLGLQSLEVLDVLFQEFLQPSLLQVASKLITDKTPLQP